MMETQQGIKRVAMSATVTRLDGTTIEKVFAFDIDETRAEKFRQRFAGELEIIPVNADGLPAALRQGIRLRR